MLRLTITGKTVQDLNRAVIEAAADIQGSGAIATTPVYSDKNPTTQFAAPQVGVGATSASSLADSPANRRPFTQAAPIAQPVAKTAAGRKPRATRAEMEARKNGTGSVDEALGRVRPTTPPMPTTQHHQSIPMGVPQHTQQVANPVVSQAVSFAPPITHNNPVNAYTFESFKANLIHVINVLANEGKIDEKWITDTATYFNNEPIQNWYKDEETLRNLFASLVEWDFVKSLEKN